MPNNRAIYILYYFMNQYDMGSQNGMQYYSRFAKNTQGCIRNGWGGVNLTCLPAQS